MSEARGHLVVCLKVLCDTQWWPVRWETQHCSGRCCKAWGHPLAKGQPPGVRAVQEPMDALPPRALQPLAVGGSRVSSSASPHHTGP